MDRCSYDAACTEWVAGFRCIVRDPNGNPVTSLIDGLLGGLLFLLESSKFLLSLFQVVARLVERVNQVVPLRSRST